MPVKDEDPLRLLDAAAEPDPGRILDARIQATLRQYGGAMELQEISDELGISRKTLWEKK
jgi:hypothetical protein